MQGECEFCGEWREVREFYRQTNPQTGFWCRNCAEEWASVVALDPMAGGGILSNGWEDEE